jgi:hypothetical protein
VRVILAGLLIGIGLIVTPTARADPQTCPPTCDQIPSTAWPSAVSLPLNGTYQWPELAPLAVPAPGSRFRFEELCAASDSPGDPRDFAVTARAAVSRPPGHWQLQAQILHWRGETWRGGQLATSVFDAAVASLRNCQVSAPQFSALLTTGEPTRMAAVISGPLVLHQYLIVDPQNSTVSELALWVAPGPGQTSPAPLVAWPKVADAKVFDAMAAPLCGAYLGSCG